MSGLPESENPRNRETGKPGISQTSNTKQNKTGGPKQTTVPAMFWGSEETRQSSHSNTLCKRCRILGTADSCADHFRSTQSEAWRSRNLAASSISTKP